MIVAPAAADLVARQTAPDVHTTVAAVAEHRGKQRQLTGLLHSKTPQRQAAEQ